MSGWSLARLLSGLHDDIQQQLHTVRHSFGHPVTKGNACEAVWLQLFEKYLPKRYQACTAHIVDSNDVFSEQIDVVIFDRQYSPFIFDYKDQKVLPAESVYAVFEAKQSANAEQLRYASQKVASVRRLHRTSMPIPHAGGTYPAKPLHHILGGLLTFESDWTPPMGEFLRQALSAGEGSEKLDMGCIAAHGMFATEAPDKSHVIQTGTKAATAFLFNLISRLQFSGTVPMIDINAYSRWLTN